MKYLRRELESVVAKAARAFPAVVLTGPRRAGKTSLLRHLFPRAEYHLFEDAALVQRFRADPQGLLESFRPPVILDEIQNVPEVFNQVRVHIDRSPRRTGQWFLTGSQESGLMRGVTESLAGRAAIFQLWPLSHRETARVGLLRGGYPEVLARPKAAGLWFASYLQTYLERDVRAITEVQDLATFRRFIGLVAARHGQIVNRSDLAAGLGMSVPAVTRWLGILEATMQILIVPPYFENLGKRLVKSPKIYLADAGLACHLLGIESDAELRRSPFLGPIFEGFVGAEIVKAQTNAGRRRQLFYFRDAKGLEVDFVVPRPDGRLRLIEAKASVSVTPAMAAPMQSLAAAWGRRFPSREPVDMRLVHWPGKAGSGVVAPGVRAETWPAFLGSSDL